MTSSTEQSIEKYCEEMRQEMLQEILAPQLQIMINKCKEKFYDAGFHAAYEDIKSAENDLSRLGYWDGFTRNEPFKNSILLRVDISSLYTSEKTEIVILKEKIVKLEEENKYLKLLCESLSSKYILTDMLSRMNPI